MSRNKYEDTGAADQTCDCCGGQFRSYKVGQYFTAGLNGDLTICHDCAEDFAEERKDEQKTTELKLTDTLPAEEFQALQDYCKLHRVFAFVPADEQIKDPSDVREFFAACHRLLAFHPDTRFPDCTDDKGQQIFDSETAAQLEICLRQCFSICQHEDVDIYRLSLDEFKDAHPATPASVPKPAPVMPAPSEPAKQAAQILNQWGVRASYEPFDNTIAIECEGTCGWLFGTANENWSGDFYTETGNGRPDNSIELALWSTSKDPLAIARSIVNGIMDNTGQP